ncbi:hypothetical protein FSOLCH5_008279 [Fusarium solani]|nr:hypothetical protein NW759_012463 [Fusarium solani]
MPRMAGLALHDSPAYQRYLEGEPGNPGTVKRWSGLRPFERDDGLFSGYANLKVHIRLAHKEVVAPAHKGASTQAEIDDASNYYTLLVARLTGADDGEGEIITPRKASGENEVV